MGDFDSIDLSLSTLTTREAITASIDYNDVSAVDPGPDDTFHTQVQVDQFLSDAGAISFKHISAFWDALPLIINHTININLAAGIHRPRPTETIFSQPLIGKQISPNVFINVNGDTVFTEILPSENITAVQLDNANPYVDVAPGTFVDDGELRGYFVEFSTGQRTIIHKHTDSRIYVNAKLSPDPTGGTVKIVEPSTVFRSSINDVDRIGYYGLSVDAGHMPFYAYFLVTGILFECLSSTTAIYGEAGSKVGFYDCIFDKRRAFIPQNGSCIYLNNARYFAAKNSSFLAPTPVTPGADNPINMGSSPISFVRLDGCYILGFEDSLRVRYGKIMIASTVFDECGRGSLKNTAAIILWPESEFRIIDYGYGIKTTIRNGESPGIDYLGYHEFNSAGSDEIYFENMSGPCVLLRRGALYDQKLDFQGNGWQDGGGNTGVGIEIQGPGTYVAIGTLTNVTGAEGDVKIDGVAGPYTDLPTSDNPLVTQGLCTVSKG